MPRRLLIGALVATAFLVLSPLAAWAHVEIDPDQVPKGSTTELSIRVPNERSGVTTVKVDVKVPTDHPIADVTANPKTGWTADVRTVTLPRPVTVDGRQVTEAVSEIIWSGGTIGPDQEEDFQITAGPLPSDVDSITFPTIQTYSDGQEVAWIEATPPGGQEPEHPAPVLKLSGPRVTTSTVVPPSTTVGPPSSQSPGSSSATGTPGTSSGGAGTTAPGGSSTGSGSGASTSPSDADPSKDDDSDGSAAPIVIAGIVVLVVGGIGGAVYLRRRRAGPPAP